MTKLSSLRVIILTHLVAASSNTGCYYPDSFHRSQWHDNISISVCISVPCPSTEKTGEKYSPSISQSWISLKILRKKLQMIHVMNFYGMVHQIRNYVVYAPEFRPFYINHRCIVHNAWGPPCHRLEGPKHEQVVTHLIGTDWFFSVSYFECLIDIYLIQTSHRALLLPWMGISEETDRNWSHICTMGCLSVLLTKSFNDRWLRTMGICNH